MTTVRRRLYSVWRTMHRRCSDPNHGSFKRYGGRGISVCHEWSSFDSFLSWAVQNGYSYGLSLDRIDNDSGYSPKNCRWVTAKDQNRNRRDNTLIEFNGEQHCISEWSEITGIGKNTIRRRMLSGWPTELVLSVSPNRHNTKIGYATNHSYRNTTKGESAE